MYQNINKIYHAAIYVRLSKEDGDISSSAKLESNSISNQKALILDFLKDKKDIEVVSVRVDDGYSGSNFERPAFQAMLEDIRRGIVDCVVVKDLSRFGREYIDSGSISRDYSRLLVCASLPSMTIMTVSRERIRQTKSLSHLRI